jgi:hypothetical protein
MEKTEINAVEMVRAIRDRMYDETKDMSRQEFLTYIRRKAARVLNEDAVKRDSARPAA